MRERFPCSAKGNLRRALCLWDFRHPSLTKSGISGIMTTAICFSVCASCLVLEPPSCHSTRTHRVTCQRRHQKHKNTAKQCRLGLFQDSDFAGDLEDSKSTSGGTLCMFGSHTIVPISWMCKKRTSVSHSSTESENMSLDAG